MKVDGSSWIYNILYKQTIYFITDVYKIFYCDRTTNCDLKLPTSLYLLFVFVTYLFKPLHEFIYFHVCAKVEHIPDLETWYMHTHTDIIINLKYVTISRI